MGYFKIKQYIFSFILLNFADQPQIKLIRREDFSIVPLGASYFSPNYTQFIGVLPNVQSNQLTYMHVEEGGNVTLDCIIIAKPVVTVVRWTHNLVEIWHEVEGMYHFQRL